VITRERHGPWALIVGGSEGIGAALAHRLAAEGIALVLVARKLGPLEETAAAVRQASGVEVRTLSLDIAEPGAFERIAEATEGLDIGLLVHNVGGGAGWGPFIEQPIDASLAAIRMNPEMQMRLVRHFAPAMAARGSGGILFIGSMAGNAGGAGLASYSGVKAFTQVFAEALWAELQPQGVDVLDLVVASADTPARRRSGTQDDPDVYVASADSVAEQALAQIGDGPVQPQAGNEEFFAALAALPRRQPVEMLRRVLSGMEPD
jgi:short-subunit dehydrogenase